MTETYQTFGSNEDTKSKVSMVEQKCPRVRKEYPKEEQSPLNYHRAYESFIVPDIQVMGNQRNFPKPNAYPTFGGGLDENWADFFR